MQTLLLVVILLYACEVAAQRDSLPSEIFITYEEMPQFPGGEVERIKFIASHLHRCGICEEVTGKIILKFDIDATGYPKDLKIIRSLHPHFLPVIKDIWAAMPSWIPGKWKGLPVNSSIIFPIKIDLE
ncbi:MAG: hypothetical protein ACKV1O_01010 [Saprospiraceae bacterium]